MNPTQWLISVVGLAGVSLIVARLWRMRWQGEKPKLHTVLVTREYRGFEVVEVDPYEIKHWSDR